MYDDLIAGTLGSPGLLDSAFTLGSIPQPNVFWSPLRVAIKTFLTDFFVPLISALGSWVRSTPLVMAVIALFFAGFLVALFFRVYHSV